MPSKQVNDFETIDFGLKEFYRMIVFPQYLIDEELPIKRELGGNCDQNECVYSWTHYPDDVKIDNNQQREVSKHEAEVNRLERDKHTLNLQYQWQVIMNCQRERELNQQQQRISSLEASIMLKDDKLRERDERIRKLEADIMAKRRQIRNLKEECIRKNGKRFGSKVQYGFSAPIS